MFPISCCRASTCSMAVIFSFEKSISAGINFRCPGPISACCAEARRSGTTWARTVFSAILFGFPLRFPRRSSGGSSCLPCVCLTCVGPRGCFHFIHPGAGRNMNGLAGRRTEQGLGSGNRKKQVNKSGSGGAGKSFSQG